MRFWVRPVGEVLVITTWFLIILGVAGLVNLAHLVLGALLGLLGVAGLLGIAGGLLYLVHCWDRLR